ncbi:hypothetical protein KR215_002870 [Drosophila sulfurigaster]|nr:hypothetical protein KR215_002870 [Drosophila sulfurigaster]
MQIEIKIYSFQSGRDGDYRELSYSIPNMSFYEFMDQYYIRFVYHEFASCTNLSGYEKFVSPWNKTLYIFSKCRPEGKTMPEIVPRGYYRVVLTISGQAELFYQLDVKVKPTG